MSNETFRVEVKSHGDYPARIGQTFGRYRHFETINDMVMRHDRELSELRAMVHDLQGQVTALNAH